VADIPEDGHVGATLNLTSCHAAAKEAVAEVNNFGVSLMAFSTTGKRIGVGIIGLSAKGGWAAAAHVPALRAVEGYELRALSASSAESAGQPARPTTWC
jgi:hypothetical protein